MIPRGMNNVQDFYAVFLRHDQVVDDVVAVGKTAKARKYVTAIPS